APPKVRALTTTRVGGVSKRPFDNLNLADHVGDQPEAVARNREFLLGALTLPGSPVWLSQVHGTHVVDAAAVSHNVIADGSFANEAGIVCAVMTADCLPLFLCNQSGDKVAVLHVGWRGLYDGVVEAGLRQLAVPNSQLIASTGPAIGPDVYEVGEDVYSQFVGNHGDAKKGFEPSGRPGHWLMDLYKLVEMRLNQLGVDQVFLTNECTYTQEKDYFSYRRERQCGRMVSLIWIDSVG
ncbi:peptidoglycan editing factor PgeF, partial [Pseudomonadota bacterium]